MSYLYEHRDKLGEHKRFAAIAYSVTFSIPPEDREDVEEKVVTTLIELSPKVKPESETIFWKHARFVVADYWDRKYREWERYSLIHESGRGETVAGERRYLTAPDGMDARLDAIAILSTLPQRLIEIGTKKLNGEPLTNAERLYRQKQTRKLRPGRPGTDHGRGEGTNNRT